MAPKSSWKSDGNVSDRRKISKSRSVRQNRSFAEEDSITEWSFPRLSILLRWTSFGRFEKMNRFDREHQHSPRNLKKVHDDDRKIIFEFSKPTNCTSTINWPNDSLNLSPNRTRGAVVKSLTFKPWRKIVENIERIEFDHDLRINVDLNFRSTLKFFHCSICKFRYRRCRERPRGKAENPTKKGTNLFFDLFFFRWKNLSGANGGLLHSALNSIIVLRVVKPLRLKKTRCSSGESWKTKFLFIVKFFLSLELIHSLEYRKSWRIRFKFSDTRDSDLCSTVLFVPLLWEIFRARWGNVIFVMKANRAL